MRLLGKTVLPPCGNCCAEDKPKKRKRRMKRRERQAWKKEVTR